MPTGWARTGTADGLLTATTSDGNVCSWGWALIGCTKSVCDFDSCKPLWTAVTSDLPCEGAGSCPALLSTSGSGGKVGMLDVDEVWLRGLEPARGSAWFAIASLCLASTCACKTLVGGKDTAGTLESSGPLGTVGLLTATVLGLDGSVTELADLG